MRLKSLEMVGFKSFTQRTSLQFTPGITAIVGPNGCGKSNIVDALRWVMGEQSARHLRGHLMEDVIFNGSESLAPTGMAEVSLVFDNEDGRGPVEYSSFSEIMVTRRLFRSGESEYVINKVPCRLKDIIELFLGTGMGSKAYSIVEQGRVDEMVNAKPEERRSLIEEAAGTSKYKSRKLVAERKLERTHQNLLRVSDIVREIERQIRSMELQAKKAERYRALKKELKEKDLAWATLQRKGLEDGISTHEARLDAAEDHLVRLLASLHSKEAESEGIRLSLLETEKEISSQQEAVYQRKVQIQGEEQRIDFYKKDQAGIQDGETKTRSELLQMQEKHRILSLEIEELKKAKETFIQLSLFEETYLRGKEEELKKANLQIQNLQTELEQEKEILIDIINQVSHLKNDLLAREKQLEEVEKGLSRNRKEESDITLSLESWREKRQERKMAWDRSLDRTKEIEREISEATDCTQEWGKVKEEQERKIEALKGRLQEARSRLVSLEDLQKNYEGYQEGVRAIMLKRQREAAFEGVYGLVAEVIEAPESSEKALTAVLGDRLQYIIVRGHGEGVEAIEYLKRESSGRGSFIPRQLSRRERVPLPLTDPEVIAPLLEMVSVKEGYREIAEYLLADVLVVRDLKSALELWNRNGFVNTLVTPEGEVIDSMGVVTGGSTQSLEGNLLSQKRRMKELEALLLELQAQLDGEEKELGVLREQMDRTETRRSVLVEENHHLALERIRLEHDCLQADHEVEGLEETLQILAQEQTDLSTTQRFLGEAIQDCQAGIEGRLQERIEREKALQEKQEILSQLEKSSEHLETEVTESRIRGAALGEKKENTHLNLESRGGLQQELSRQIQSRESEIAQMKQKSKQLDEGIRLAEKSLEEGKKNLKELEERLGGERQKYRDISHRLAEIEEAIKELRPLAEASQEEKNQLQLLLSEKRLNLQHLLEAIREKYDLDLKEMHLEGLEGELSGDNLLTEIEELRSRLERMGEVNLAAISEFEELNSRYQFLNQQKQDLEKSIADLQRTIVKLNRVCRLRFRESFEQINQRFEEIFPRLFQGGKARLVLTDENDYLDTGVDIIAQPPGKKLQSITLLSGGEKALTAVSLLFAIFLTKPSPFCFLDEVDAPLDDANIDRFNELVKELSQSSQFVLVTHNKITMQAAKVLYGITMAEPGVSKVVSVKMN
ncbi:MAG: chromosome segregation protein SMC [Deltaproteobacteria bacterium]|nr:chromosome segregation protein SMC [Deltaproteobacteria bacterium]